MSECPTCGESFANENGMKAHHTVVHGESLRPTTTCDRCGEEYTVPRGAKGKYCSLECLHDSNKSENQCDACGRQIPNWREYCCPACQTEARVERPRPDDSESLLWLLYVYEGFSIRETWRRQRAVLGVDECLSETQVRDKLDELGIKREYHTGRWSLKDANPVDIGESKPEGDDSWKRLQRA